MPKGKRAPINYTPQFGGGIFRSQDVVADELAALEHADNGNTPDSIPDPPIRTNERTVERTVERNRVRHSFDIWQDQLLALAEIQAQRFSRTGRKPKIGELVQEALDAYIAMEHKRMVKGTNERTNERTD